MKSFEDISREMNLTRYIGSELGTMYFDPKAPREKETIIRHLDGKLTIELLPAYVSLYNSIVQWIANNPSLNEYVFMPGLVEVGKDYFIRPFYSYYVSTRDFADKDEPIEPPSEYKEMHKVAFEELKSTSGKEETIRRILRKSLLEPTAKTYFEDDINKFIIVEPKISIEDIEEWKGL